MNPFVQTLDALSPLAILAGAVVIVATGCIAWLDRRAARRSREPPTQPIPWGVVLPGFMNIVRNAFMEGRESTTGTDRHHADAAWDNSRTKAKMLVMQRTYRA
jgi:hypothetical protein